MANCEILVPSPLTCWSPIAAMRSSFILLIGAIASAGVAAALNAPLPTTFETTMDRLSCRVTAHGKLVSGGWAAAGPVLGALASKFSGSVEVSPMPGAGNGLIADVDLPAFTLIQFYPAHQVGMQVDGEAYAAPQSDEDRLYFQSLRAPAGYRQEFGNAGVFIDANPTKAHSPGWLGHLINDGAVCGGDARADLLSYYETSEARRNCINVGFGPSGACEPTMAYVTTRAVTAGEEFLTTYSHRFWLSKRREGSSAVDEADAELVARLRCLHDATVATKEAVLVNYEDAIHALSEFLAREETAQATQHTCTHAHARTHVLTQAHARTHTHAHTHTQTTALPIGRSRGHGREDSVP